MPRILGSGAGEPVEQRCEGCGILEHREVAAGDLDRLDVQELLRDELLPLAA